jgi:electron transport complex protein RnfE
VKAVVNAIGMGLGFTLALLCLGIVREILGAGALFGFDLFGPQFQPWVVMILPPGGFLVLGAWLLVFDWFRQRKEQQTLSGEQANVA